MKNTLQLLNMEVKCKVMEDMIELGVFHNIEHNAKEIMIDYVEKLNMSTMLSLRNTINDLEWNKRDWACELWLKMKILCFLYHSECLPVEYKYIVSLKYEHILYTFDEIMEKVDFDVLFSDLTNVL